jgi:hypothetical protein
MENPYQSPTSRPDDDVRAGEDPATAVARLMTAAKRRILYWMLALAAASGLLLGWLGPDTDPDLDGATGILLNLLFVILLVRWCEYDRMELAVSPWRFFTVMMIVCPGWPIIMPFYFLSTRGPAKGALAIGKGMLFLGLWMAVFMGVGIVTTLLLHALRIGF